MSKTYLTICAAIAVTALPASGAPAAQAKPAQSAQIPTRAALTKNINESFKAADTNGDGTLSVQEVSATEAKVLKQRVAMARQRMEQEFAKLDTNKDGQLSPAEFNAMAGPIRTVETPQQLLQKLDTNHDGKVSMEEYRAPEIAKFNRADANHDGVVTPAEAAALVRK